MKKNMGTADRILRIVIAAIIVALYFAHVITSTVAIVLLAFAGIFILTSFMSVCFLYLPFGISTIGKKK